MNREDIKKITEQLNIIESNSTENFNVDYAGFQDNIEKGLLYIINAMFPGYTRRPEGVEMDEDIKTHYLARGYEALRKALIQHGVECPEDILDKFVAKIPKVYEILQSDVIAAYQGDPAAKSVDEVILCYPAFLAIAAYRIAHELYLLNQPMVARLMTEYVHRKTGIDIHPGATIGRTFFIDHGTGVVIGETTVIGDNVKLYQHVTLGAKSFDVEPDGSLVKGIKRHPNIGNNVVIYAGATILGGDVYIGDDCVIGGNVWLTKSVASGLTVLPNIPEPTKMKI